MALQKQIVSMNLGRGVDTGTDIKVGPDADFSDLKDFVYPKLKRLDKRPGTNRLSTTVQTPFTSPLGIGPSILRTTCFANRDELLLQNRGALYSYFQGQTKWNFKAHFNPIEVDTKPLASNQYSLTGPDSASVGGVTVTAYLAQNNISSVYTVRYCVVENATGNYIADDVAIEDITLSNLPYLTEAYIKIVTFSNAAFITFVNQGNLRITKVNLTDGTIGAISSLKTDLALPVVVTANISKFSEFPPDFVWTNKPGVGERVFCTYCNYASGFSVNVFAITNTGAIDASIGTYTLAESVIRGMSITYNTTAAKLFVAYQTSNFDIVSLNLSFTSSSLTLGLRQVVQTLTARIVAITQSASPVTPAQQYLFYDQQAYYFAPENKLYKAQVSASAIITSGTLIGQGLALFGKAFTDSIRSTIYLPCFYGSKNQGSLFLVDTLKGKSEAGHYIAAKWLSSLFTGDYTPKLQQVTSIGSNMLQFAQSYKTKIIAGTPSADIAPLFQKGISLSQINLAPQRSASKAYLSEATHLSGGFMGYYDGSTFCEQGFFIDPEKMDLGVSTGSARISLQVASGSPTTQEVTTVTCLSGAMQLPGPAYWTFNTTTAPYYVWYKINGTGTDPVVGGKIGIMVTLTGSETAAEVAQANIDAVNAALPTAIAGPLVFGGGPSASWKITNNINGDVTDASSSNYVTAGTLEVGTYQYVAVWAWVDVNGQVVRSAPSIPLSATVGVINSTVGVMVHCPPVTNRLVTEARVEIYRTAKNLTTFYKITSFNRDIPWDLASCRVTFTDNTSDSVLTGYEPLYTTGGVFENIQIPACKSLSTFKNRILVSGIDNNTIYYSKSAQNGAPVEFTNEGILRFDNNKDPITAHVQLDDKLVAFKKNKIIYVAGDGINDLGGGGTFTQPITLPFNIGTDNQNSVVTCTLGVMFKSEKGIFLLDRSMQLVEIGKPVKDYNQFTVSRAEILTDDNELTQVRFNLSDAPYTLVFDYSTNMWSVFSNYGGTDACIWQGSYTRVDFDGFCYVEDKSIFKDVGSTVPSYSPTFQTQWVQAKDVQDYQRIYRLGILGELKSPHTLNYAIYYDYDETNFDSYSFDSSVITGSNPGDSVYQPIIHLKRQKCEAIKIRVTAVPVGGTEESLTLTDLSFEVGLKQGLMKVKSGKKL